jgi:hypothetical protein
LRPEKEKKKRERNRDQKEPVLLFGGASLFQERRSKNLGLPLSSFHLPPKGEMKEDGKKKKLLIII